MAVQTTTARPVWGGPAEAAGRGSAGISATMIPDVAAVVQQYGGVRLRRVGRRYVGLCPLHADRRPSLSVDPSGNRWYCFGCGAGGGPVQWVMAVLRLDKPAALARLRADGWLSDTPEARRAWAERRRAWAVEQAARGWQLDLAGRLAARCRELDRALAHARPDSLRWERALLAAWDDRLQALLDGGPGAELAAEEVAAWL